MNNSNYGTVTGGSTTTSSTYINGSTTSNMHIAWWTKNGSNQTAGSTGNISVNITIQGTSARFDFAFQIPTSYSTTGSWSGWSFSSIIINGNSGSFTSGNYKINYEIPDPSNNF